MEDRVRKINVDKLTSEEADLLGQQLGDKLREMVDETCCKANRLLAIYGLKVKMNFALEPLTNKTKGE